MPSANIPIATSAMIRTGVHQDVPSRARRPERAADQLTAGRGHRSSLVGRTGSGSSRGPASILHWAWAHILPYET